MTNKSEPIELAAGNIKAAMKQANATKADLWKVPREFIRVIPGFNVRNSDDPDYQQHIRWIADSIKENGFYSHKPLAGYVGKDGEDDVIFLTDGHTRLAAIDIATAEGAEIASLPVIVSPRGTSLEDLTVALYTSNTGRPLTPYETGQLCKRLISFGWTEKQIAERLVLSITQVNNCLDLAAAPLSVRKLVSEGKVSATAAIQTLHTHGTNATSVLEKAVEVATQAGKERATAKHIQAVAESDPLQPEQSENTTCASQQQSQRATGPKQTKAQTKALVEAATEALNVLESIENDDFTETIERLRGALFPA